MKIIFSAKAESELVDAIEYYNAQTAGLGYELADQIQNALKRIQDYPEA